MVKDGLKISLDEFSQTIDLDKWVGAPVSKDTTLSRAIMQEVIDYTKSRVSDGLGYGEKPLRPKYSKAYTNSDDFIAAGKTGVVNMTLSGDMIGALDILDESGSKFTYGLADDDEIPKAYNHQTGDTLPKRKWFGLTRDEFRENILPKFKKDISDIKPRPDAARAQDAMIKSARTVRAFVEDEDE